MSYYCSCGWGKQTQLDAPKPSLERAAVHGAINGGPPQHIIYRDDGNMSVAEGEYVSGYAKGRGDALAGVRRSLDWIYETPVVTK